MVKIVAVDDRVLQWVGARQRHGTAGLGCKQLRDDTERVLVIDWELIVLLRAAVRLSREELDIRLLGGQSHGVSAGEAGGVAPQGLVFQTVVETGEGERAEGEGREEAGLVLPVFLERLFEGVVVVDFVAVGDARLGGFVEDEDDLRMLVEKDRDRGRRREREGEGREAERAAYKMVHQVLADAWEVNETVDTKLGELVVGSDARAHEDRWTAVCASRDNDFAPGVVGFACPVCGAGQRTHCPEAVARPLDNDAVDRRIGLDSDIGAIVLLGNEVG